MGAFGISDYREESFGAPEAQIYPRAPNVSLIAAAGTNESKNTAEGGSRTLTLLPGRDFESRASASSATSAVLTDY